jgi:hypothetical protein
MLETDVPAIPIGTEGALPPWGDLNTGGLKTLAYTKLPSQWSFELDDYARELQFRVWWFSTLYLINRHLWPRYNRRRTRWEGESTTFMRRLTEADLQLMLEIQHPAKEGRQFQKPLASDLRPPGIVTHHDLYSKEDQCDGANIFSNFAPYNRLADDKTLAAISSLCWTGDSTRQTPVAYLFKRALQRPRPMQMALHFGLSGFNYEEATSSLTPSMLSGHCIQGLLGVGTVIERFLDDGLLTPELRRTLPQWAVDIGDRRVLAGIHYPTDSLSSWVIFMRMADFVYNKARANEVKDLLREAITTKSYVYQEMIRFAATSDGAVYEEPLSLLEQSFKPVTLTDFEFQGDPAEF